MGMRDEIRWDASLPAGHPSTSGRLFRTNSLGQACEDHYVVTPTGRLLLVGNGWQDDTRFESESLAPVDVDFHGDIELVSEDGRLAYMARFTHGTLEWVRPLAEGEPWNTVAIAVMKFLRGGDTASRKGPNDDQ